jgi:hypothetical protein
MENRDKLGISEFEEVLLDCLSTIIIPRSYIEENKEFWDSIVFKLFEDYYYSPEPLSIRKQAKTLDIVFNSLFTFKPPVEKPTDILNLD